uniref:Uncharacterized protein n=1 Tax=Anguilla anguilla TaxID=7936 RepID=A0A0E9UW95_ANGAN
MLLLLIDFMQFLLNLCKL